MIDGGTRGVQDVRKLRLVGEEGEGCLIMYVFRPYYTMHCFTCVLDVSLAFWMFPHVSTCVLDTNMLVPKTQVKT